MERKLSELTLDELKERKKKIAGVSIGLGIVMAIACPFLFYFAITQKNYALMVVATGSLASLAPGLSVMSQIKKEIKTRETKTE
ncbi:MULTISPECIES: hypothetical protein [unclassified Sphingobacterium]|uniref:hypothetical protein n=1 Tax=unclassified Sphingobacterium TaxID=2609468 RepID=UPI0025D8274D|nr:MULTISPECIES: hypothetical protein [unclassified Sphingobacterium]